MSIKGLADIDFLHERVKWRTIFHRFDAMAHITEVNCGIECTLS